MSGLRGGFGRPREGDEALFRLRGEAQQSYVQRGYSAWVVCESEDSKAESAARGLKAMRGMSCPKCGGIDSRCLDTRVHCMGFRRRRQCLGCGLRWTTVELTDEAFRLFRGAYLERCKR